MDKLPLISICIPAYMRTANLRRLLDSIEIQEYRSFEVVITDDSPDDQIKNLVVSHTLYPKVRYFKNLKTRGTPENWNEGVRRAEGDWIKPMHDDDWFRSPESLGIYARAIQNSVHSFFYSAFINVFSDGRQEPVRYAGYTARVNQNPDFLIAANRIGPPSCIIMRRDDLLLFDNRMRWLVDIDFYMRYLKKHPVAVFLPERLVYIGISETQVTSTSFGNPLIEIPERFLLLEKMGVQSLNSILIYDSWWRFVRNMRIDSDQQIRKAGYSGSVPEFVKQIMQLQQKIPRNLLDIGITSKLLMALQFFWRKKAV